MSQIYLILIIHGQALWGMPQPYPDMKACDVAGMHWSSGGPPDPGTRGYYCLPGPIVKPQTHCRVVDATIGSGPNLMVCE